MTDQEVICTFMNDRKTSGYWGDWWGVVGSGIDMVVVPKKLNLDVLWEVEARLTDEQWDAYKIHLHETFQSIEYIREFIHATAAQKISALAAILRPIVETEVKG